MMTVASLLLCLVLLVLFGLAAGVAFFVTRSKR